MLKTLNRKKNLEKYMEIEKYKGMFEFILN